MAIHKKGAVGIGTLIIFIAMVLVAAVAAAVLINVSGILQQRAMATGKESIKQVSSNIVVVNINGVTDSARSGIGTLQIAISAAAGAERIDLRYLVLEISNGANQTYMNYSSTTGGLNNFTAEEVRDPNNLYDANNPVIDQSSLIRLLVDCENQSPQLNFPPRQSYKLTMIPEHGASIQISGITTEAYPYQNVEIYP
jgi:archaeal flagellin FlaB